MLARKYDSHVILVVPITPRKCRQCSKNIRWQ